MKDDTLNVVRVMRRAIKTPDVERRAEDKIATGAANVPNSNSSTMKTNTTARTSTKTRSRNVIMVIGIVAKNGILLLDAEQKFRRLGLSSEEAMLQASQR